MLTKNKLIIIWILGLISGFTIMISGNTLNYWLATEQIDLRTIGIFAFISIPYAINFIWATIFDTKTLGRLSLIFGQRLSWVMLIQLFLAIAVFMLSKLTPSNNLLLFAIIGLVISFLGSAQDTVLGALRTEIISKEAQGAASGVYIFGYRIGMLISSFGAIYLSDYISWNEIYQIFALVILFCPILLVLNIKNIALNNKTHSSEESGINLSSILRPVGSWSFIITAIIFLILYRLPDNFINIMINPFLIHLGYTSKQIATTGKFFGIITAIIGGLIASWVMRKRNITDSLLIFGILHAIAHSLFIIQDIYGKNLTLFFIVTGFESITGGMAMAAYIAFIASLCQGKFRATQYSFFSSMMGFSRAFFPALSGYIVVDFGWRTFFTFTTIAALPALLLLHNRLLSKIKA